MARASDAVFPLSILRDRTFQMRQVRRVVWLVLFFVIQSTLVLGVFYHQLLDDLVAGTAPLLFASEDLVALDSRIPGVGDVMLEWLVVMLGLNACVTLGVAVFILRRLGSPLLAIRRALAEIGDGNLAVRLRRDDAAEFSELSDALNSAVARIQAKLDEARAETEHALQRDADGRPDGPRLEAALMRCRSVLDYFGEIPTSLGGTHDAANESCRDGPRERRDR